MTPCQHHWILDTPNGPLADAKCKECGSFKQFPNAAEWGYDAFRTEGTMYGSVKMKEKLG